MSAGPRRALNGLDLRRCLIQSAGHLLVHQRRVGSFHEIRFIAVAGEEVFQLFVGQTRQYGGAGNFVSVQVQDGEYGTVARWIQKLIGVPTRSQWAGFGLSIAHDATGQQVRVIENRAIGVQQRITKLATFVNRPGSFGRDMAGNSARERKLFEEPLHALSGLRNLRIVLAVGAFQIGIGNDPGATMTRARHVDHIEVSLPDQAIEMNIDEIETGRGAPVTDQAGLNVGGEQRLPE